MDEFMKKCAEYSRDFVIFTEYVIVDYIQDPDDLVQPDFIVEAKCEI